MRKHGLYYISMFIFVYELCCTSAAIAKPPTPPMRTEYLIRILRDVNPGDCPIVELEYTFGPSQRSQGKETIVTLTANNGLRIFGDSSWQIVLKPDQSREGTLTLHINPNDTSSFDLHIEGGARPETHSYYFVYEPGNIECFEGNRFVRRPVRNQLKPFVYKISLEIDDPNDLWFESINWNGKYAGFVHSVKSRSDTNLAPVFVMHETYSTADGGRARKHNIYCDDNKFMTTKFLANKYKSGSYGMFDTVFFSEGTWSTPISRHNKFDTRPDDLYEKILCHVIQNLPYIKGVILKYSIPQWDGGYRRPERTIEYLGQENVRVIDVCDSTVMLHKIVDTDNHYYLDDNHNLVLVHNRVTNLIRVTKGFLTLELLEVNWDSLETALVNR